MDLPASIQPKTRVYSPDKKFEFHDHGIETINMKGRASDAATTQMLLTGGDSPSPNYQHQGCQQQESELGIKRLNTNIYSQKEKGQEKRQN